MPYLDQYEFHRTAVGLLPDKPGNQAGSAIYVRQVPNSAKSLRSCTCGDERTCSHLKELTQGLQKFRQRFGKKTWEDVFNGSFWSRLARQLFESEPTPCAEIIAHAIKDGDASALRITSKRGQELAYWLDDSGARKRFLERLGKAPDDRALSNRSGLIERLSLFQTSAEERQLNQAGVKTNRQSWEESFWFRLAYHCLREVEPGKGSFLPGIDEETGEFTLTFQDEAEEAMVLIVVPRPRVQAVIKILAENFPDEEAGNIYPLPFQSIFRITRETELDMEVRPVIRALQQAGEESFFQRKDLGKFTYGPLIYVKLLGILAELDEPNSNRKFRAPAKMKLRRSRVVSFRNRFRDPNQAKSKELSNPTNGLNIFRQVDFVEISPEALERSWYWLSVNYGFGNQSISLALILKAREQGLPYLETAEGWVDLNAPAFSHLDSLLERQALKKTKHGERLRFTASQLLRLQATTSGEVRVRGDKERVEMVEGLLSLDPPSPYEAPDGLSSTLRPYQEIGVDWLRFLFANRLSGLLCDDMGLGKTHQAMALMLGLLEEDKAKHPFLVVCPTSVISHWRNKIRDHAPGLTAEIYHGPERDLECYLYNDVILTSYGILRNDIEELSQLPFTLAIFDEIQHIKNKGTLAYQAALELLTTTKLGLTGTPIENSLEELKTLFDLLLPGYLGNDAEFSRRYRTAAMDEADDAATRAGLAELRRTISPFMLRRLKSTVLDELPEKIEDLRTCTLSDDQLKLYREAIANRAGTLVDRLRDDGASLPYIHIFALLNYLKQVCNHPALALGDLDQVSAYDSGKWDLFLEILQESLDSGQKVVIFTQYLGMISLMQRHLKKLRVPHVSLTGSTRKRGEVIDRFNNDLDCRVFLGSLKAGGTGIDLVGGSVVIHYDRWWNAAREDQATDRVHRMGQKRVVQVFKLVTEGTLEEKIDAIIEHKRNLMESVVREDDPKLAKIFSRDELLDLLESV